MSYIYTTSFSKNRHIKTAAGDLSKPTRTLDLMLKKVSEQPHVAKNVAYELSFYGIVWILVRQGPFMD